MENEDVAHEYAPLFDVYHHLLTVSRIFDCLNQRFLNFTILYNSKTGFTRKYAQLLAEELGCAALPLGDAPADLSQYAAVAFGRRLHAGVVDGWKKAQKLLNSRGAKKLVVFATGAMPNGAGEQIRKSGNRTSPLGSWTPSPTSTSRRGCAWRSWARVTGPC